VKGAEAVLRTLAAAGVQVCFANPGTTELDLIAALDAVPQVRGVPTLYEGVATGAADGYGRIAGRPAATLLHLGPGLADGIANLHNARAAGTPVLNIVGGHATSHQAQAPFPLSVTQLAATVSGWIRSSAGSGPLPEEVADAVAAAAGPPGCVATLVIPADLSWSAGPGPAQPRPPRALAEVPEAAIRDAAQALGSGQPAAIVLGTAAAREPALIAAARVAHATGARLYLATFPAVIDRGAGLPAIPRLGYPTAAMASQLAGIRRLVLVDTHLPVPFFAAPPTPDAAVGASGPASGPAVPADGRGLVVPADCTVHWLGDAGQDVTAALDQLASQVGAASGSWLAEPEARPPRPGGPLTPDSFAAAVAALLPDHAIVVDESLTCGFAVPAMTKGAPRHEWLCGTGLAIGQGLPAATGAAIAAPGRKVICLEADGSAMYTIQALWTQAREGLDVTTVICNNQAYGVLRMELGRTGGPAAGAAVSLLDLGRPTLDFTAMARSMGVSASRASTADELVSQLERAIAEPGPALVEAMFAAPGGH
jgi:acetolactate synthase-1/2/3 large subunit